MNSKMAGIFEDCTRLFMRCGIKSLTMDDLAKNLRVSKKTLYKYVSDKNDLVQKTLKSYCCRDEKIIREIVKNNENAIDELIEISRYISGKLQQVHPSVHYDLEKYYPEAWKVFNDHKYEFIFDCVKSNLEKGIAQGYYREKLHTEVVAKIYISRIDMVFDPEVFPVDRFNFAEVYMEMLRYHIRGIASEKGIQYLMEKVKKQDLRLYE